MRYSYIEPVMKTVGLVLGDIIHQTVRTGELELHAHPLASQGVTTSIGIDGEVNGRVMLDMNIETAIRLARSMGAQWEHPDEATEISEKEVIDEITSDAVSELTSMLVGRAVAALNEQGHALRVTPVSLVKGDGPSVPLTQYETVVFTLSTECGRLRVNLSIATSPQEGSANVTA